MGFDVSMHRNKGRPLHDAGMLLERKRIYEDLHPETRQGGDHGNQHTGGKTTGCRFATFSDDAAVKAGISKRTVEREVLIAEALAPEVKEIVRQAGHDVVFTCYARGNVKPIFPEQVLRNP